MKILKLTHENTQTMTDDVDAALDVIIDIELYFQIMAEQKNIIKRINDPQFSKEYKQELLGRYSIKQQALKDLFI